MWTFNVTPEYVRCCEELSISQEVKDAIERWAITVGRTPTKLQKTLYRSDNKIFEMWVARLPDPDSRKGKSGGFRLVYFFNLKESSIHVDRLERRDEKGNRDERPRDQQKAAAYVEMLKEHLEKLSKNGI